MTKQLFDSGFDWCPPDARAGEFYKLRIKDLSPTQFAVGKAEVAVRTVRLRKKYNKDPGKLHDYLSQICTSGPPAPDLARELRVNPATVAKAYQRLTEAGVLTVRRGEGTFVAERAANRTGQRRDVNQHGRFVVDLRVVHGV